MKNVLITEGAGFIGSHGANGLLTHGYHARVSGSPEDQGARALNGIDAAGQLAAAVAMIRRATAEAPRRGLVA